MIAIVLGLVSAALLGVSDFVNALVTRRSSPWAIAILACAGAGMVGAAVAPLVGGRPTTTDLIWGAVSGVGSAVGTAYLYRGLASGRMGVVAPVSAVGAALLPIALGVLLGERPGANVWAAIALGLPGIWLVARGTDTTPRESADVRNGLIAGVGFGVLFGGLGQVSAEGSYWTFVVCEVIAVVVLIGLCASARVRWTPASSYDAIGVLGGLLAGAGTLSFMFAAQFSLLAIAAVLSSLYPAVTILLAVVVLKEAITRPQAAGLALCAITVGLLAAG